MRDNIELGFDSGVQRIINGAIEKTKCDIKERVEAAAREITQTALGELMAELQFNIIADLESMDVFKMETKYVINVSMKTTLPLIKKDENN